MTVYSQGGPQLAQPPRQPGQPSSQQAAAAHMYARLLEGCGPAAAAEWGVPLGYDARAAVLRQGGFQVFALDFEATGLSLSSPYITPTMVSDPSLPDLAAAAAACTAFVEARTPPWRLPLLCGHSIHGFDLPLLRRCLREDGAPDLPPYWLAIDTLQARQLAAALLRRPAEARHRALLDARQAAALLAALLVWGAARGAALAPRALARAAQLPVPEAGGKRSR
ncbi:MAG: hypothetical protein J3K34DRAFT_464612 [Monoraphidium minutum]|nr:MAG: hypothetical protein J3K34DRAFT_464612 [Monoraphidium minutum]